MHEKRIAHLFGLALGGLFAISLILSAMSIWVEWYRQLDDADASLRAQTGHAGGSPRSVSGSSL